MKIEPMSYDEAVADIAKSGGRRKWRESNHAHNLAPEAEPAPVEKSGYVRAVETIAKEVAFRNITLSQYFRENPAEYRALRRMGYANQ